MVSAAVEWFANIDNPRPRRAYQDDLGDFCSFVGLTASMPLGQYAKVAGIEVVWLGVHGLRATAATNALEHEADISKVHAWLGHANISTSKLYNRRHMRRKTHFKVSY